MGFSIKQNTLGVGNGISRVLVGSPSTIPMLHHGINGVGVNVGWIGKDGFGEWNMNDGDFIHIYNMLDQ
jgi:hypothetical protein